MADIIQFVKKQINDVIKISYPHLRLPAAVRAVVTQAETDGSGGTYRLRLLDRNGEIDGTVPEIPEVRSSHTLQAGDIICVVLLYGQLLPYIVGRCSK